MLTVSPRLRGILASMTLTQLQDEALRLSIDERAKLAQSLWSSVEQETAESSLTEAQRRTLDQRLDGFLAGSRQSVSWEEAKAQLWPDE